MAIESPAMSQEIVIGRLSTLRWQHSAVAEAHGLPLQRRCLIALGSSRPTLQRRLAAELDILIWVAGMGQRTAKLQDWLRQAAETCIALAADPDLSLGPSAERLRKFGTTLIPSESSCQA